ncbi:hypothetical protein V2W30_35525 [Streptomyces sp. Q6]|uniref:Uncharacterized protein n=1 Tax=Streptomyces citrinus TaxID=3118173 RepID=A0ACD5AM60_9ACTN
MRTFLPPEFWWTFGELLVVSMVLILVTVAVADTLYLRCVRRRERRRDAARHPRVPAEPRRSPVGAGRRLS